MAKNPLSRTIVQFTGWRASIVFGCIFLSLITVGRHVLAMPPAIPSSFYGTVSINGENVPLDTEVSAWIDGHWILSVSVKLDKGLTVYAIDIPGDDPTTPDLDGGRPGDEVLFQIGSQWADQKGTWQSGANQELDLTATEAKVWIYIFPLFFR